MAITTYAELKTAVENWLDHQLFTDRVAEFNELVARKLADPDWKHLRVG